MDMDAFQKTKKKEKGRKLFYCTLTVGYPKRCTKIKTMTSTDNQKRLEKQLTEISMKTNKKKIIGGEYIRQNTRK